MDTNEIIEIMMSKDADKATVKMASRKLTRIRLHKISNLRIIAKLYANGYEDIARRFAADNDINIELNSATDHIICQFGNSAEREQATERLNQRRINRRE